MSGGVGDPGVLVILDCWCPGVWEISGVLVIPDSCGACVMEVILVCRG